MVPPSGQAFYPPLDRLDVNPEASVIRQVLFVAFNLLLNPRNGVNVRYS
jgi:hypothetical protein